MIEEEVTSSNRYRPTGLALTPHLQAAKTRIQEIVADNLIGRYSRGDDSATTLVSIGYILLASALADTRSPAELSAVTGFPDDFSEAVVSVMDEFELWQTDWFTILQYVAHRGKASPEEVKDAFNGATGGFYEVDWPREYFARFEITRARVVIGGETQNYIDETFFDEFVRRREPFIPVQSS